MLLRAAKELNIDLSESWMIGDSESDIEAGKRAGCKTALIGNNRKAEADNYLNSLYEFTEKIICSV